MNFNKLYSLFKVLYIRLQLLVFYIQNDSVTYIVLLPNTDNTPNIKCCEVTLFLSIFSPIFACLFL